MLVKDGQEIKPSEPEDQEPPEPEEKLSKEEIIEALSIYAEVKGLKPGDKLDDATVAEALSIYAEMKQGRTQQVKAAPAAPKQKQPEPEEETDDSYGEYERVPEGEKVSLSDKLDGIKYALSPYASKLAIVGIAVVALLFMLVGYKAYINKVAETVGTPTTVPVTAPVDQNVSQPVQSVQPVQPSGCNRATTRISSLSDQTTADGKPYCMVSFENGGGSSAYGTCASLYQVGSEVSYCQ